MSTINKILLVGRLARDPELKQVNEKMSCCRLTIVTEHVTKSREGEQKKETCFMDCTVWNAEALRCVQYLKKGSTIAVEGRIKQEEWIDKSNNSKRTRHVIAPDTVTFMEKIPNMAIPTETKPVAPQPELKLQSSPHPFEEIDEFSF